LDDCFLFYLSPAFSVPPGARTFPSRYFASKHFCGPSAMILSGASQVRHTAHGSFFFFPPSASSGLSPLRLTRVSPFPFGLTCLPVGVFLRIPPTSTFFFFHHSVVDDFVSSLNSSFFFSPFFCDVICYLQFPPPLWTRIPSVDHVCRVFATVDTPNFPPPPPKTLFSLLTYSSPCPALGNFFFPKQKKNVVQVIPFKSILILSLPFSLSPRGDSLSCITS